jgi:dihydrofolate reductase
MNTRFSAIAAIDLNRAIGFQNNLIDKKEARKEDFEFFKAITTGKTIVMGRKTFDSIGKPLPNRKNIVISRSSAVNTAVQIVSNPCNYDWTQYDGEILIIGGSQIWEIFLPYIDTFYITQLFHVAPEADAFLPVLDNFKLSEVLVERPTYQIQKWVRLENTGQSSTY